MDSMLLGTERSSSDKTSVGYGLEADSSNDITLMWSNAQSRSIKIHLIEELRYGIDDGIDENIWLETGDIDNGYWKCTTSSLDLNDDNNVNPVRLFQHHVSMLTFEGWTAKQLTFVNDVLSAASSYNVASSSSKYAVGSGLRCITSALQRLSSVAFAFRQMSNQWASGGDEIYCWRLVRRSNPTLGEVRHFSEEVHDFLYALEEISSAQSPGKYSCTVLCRHFASSSSSAKKNLTKDILQLYYGILLLFILRAILKEIYNLPQWGFQSSERQTALNRDFNKGWASGVYQPMSYALGVSEMSFSRYLHALENDDAGLLRAHCKKAARLVPVSTEAFILEHVAYFFELFYPPSETDMATELSRRAEMASAQLVELQMG